MEEAGFNHTGITNPESAIVRIFSASGSAVGSGFLISKNLILTCSHVIQSASGIEKPALIEKLDLPLLAAREFIAGRVIFQDLEKDIACIEPLQALPPGAAPVSLVNAEAPWGHTFRAFGFPRGHENGVWASGVIRGGTAEGWLQIEDIKGTGFGIQPGFSGGLVWDEQLQAVIGMIVASETEVSIKAAYCIPTQVLVSAYSPLSKSVDHKQQSTPKKNIAPRRRKVIQRTFFSVIAMVIILAAPWIYNQNFYRVPRPEVPQTCQPSHKPVEVAIASLAKCSPEVRTDLVNHWKDQNGLVQVTSISEEFQTAEVARANADGKDMVIWGSCQEENGNTPDLNFELLESRSPVEVFEPAAVHAAGTVTDLEKVGKALFHYQRGEYPEAAPLFERLAGTVSSEELPLLQANNQMFTGKYDLAISLYNELLQPPYPFAAAASNNLGVALNNKDASFYKDTKLLGLTEFSRAIELASRQEEDALANTIKTIALYNRSLTYNGASQWSDSLNDCEAAKTVNASSALPYLCLANYSFDSSSFNSLNLPKSLPLNTINFYLAQAEERNGPPVTHVLRAAWYMGHTWKQKQEAVDEYARYLTEMENRACLATDQVRIGEVKYFLDTYTR